MAGIIAEPPDIIGRMKPSDSLFVPLRGLRYHCRCWGREGAPALFMLHGWMDVGASFQFLVTRCAATGAWSLPTGAASG